MNFRINITLDEEVRVSMLFQSLHNSGNIPFSVFPRIYVAKEIGEIRKVRRTFKESEHAYLIQVVSLQEYSLPPFLGFFLHFKASYTGAKIKWSLPRYKSNIFICGRLKKRLPGI